MDSVLHCLVTAEKFDPTTRVQADRPRKVCSCRNIEGSCEATRCVQEVTAAVPRRRKRKVILMGGGSALSVSRVMVVPDMTVDDSLSTPEDVRRRHRMEAS